MIILKKRGGWQLQNAMLRVVAVLSFGQDLILASPSTLFPEVIHRWQNH